MTAADIRSKRVFAGARLGDSAPCIGQAVGCRTVRTHVDTFLFLHTAPPSSLYPPPLRVSLSLPDGWHSVRCTDIVSMGYKGNVRASGRGVYCTGKFGGWMREFTLFVFLDCNRRWFFPYGANTVLYVCRFIFWRCLLRRWWVGW